MNKLDAQSLHSMYKEVVWNHPTNWVDGFSYTIIVENSLLYLPPCIFHSNLCWNLQQQFNRPMCEWFLKGFKIVIMLATNSAIKISKLNINIQK